MKTVFNSWIQAREATQKLANSSKLDTYVERAVEYGRLIWRIGYLPPKKNSFGWETRVERVTPVGGNNGILS